MKFLASDCLNMSCVTLLCVEKSFRYYNVVILVIWQYSKKVKLFNSKHCVNIIDFRTGLAEPGEVDAINWKPIIV